MAEKYCFCLSSNYCKTQIVAFLYLEIFILLFEHKNAFVMPQQFDKTIFQKQPSHKAIELWFLTKMIAALRTRSQIIGKTEASKKNYLKKLIIKNLCNVFTLACVSSTFSITCTYVISGVYSVGLPTIRSLTSSIIDYWQSHFLKFVGWISEIA